MRILIAPNAFKNSLTADKAAEAISMGLMQSKLDCHTHCFPVGDGGDGTAQLLIQHFNAKTINAIVHDPIGRKINASFGLVDHDTPSPRTAIIELANASGLRLLHKNEYDPFRTTTYGTGELIKIAMDQGVEKIILCIGGSATVDGGSGLLQALGVKFLDEEGNELKQLPGLLSMLDDIDITDLDKRLANTELVILCDVENKLLGINGAASVFGPQKGASDQDVQQLEISLTKFREIAFKKIGKDMSLLKHGGAAGGVSAGLNTFLNAKIIAGIEYFLDITKFDKALLMADLVITGEGSIDLQTLHGKGPYGVAKRAKKRSIPVIGLAGTIPQKTNEELTKYFDVLLSINKEDMNLHIAMQNTYENLNRSAKLLGDQLSIKKK
ncbi:MAG: glycerate kinase [Bacteroidia bacterium]|nr:glycerate kinase [Bacteroidia bacterium]